MARNNAGSVAAPARPNSHKLERRIAVLPEHAQRRMTWFAHTADVQADQEEGLFTATRAAYARLEAARTDVAIAQEKLANGEGDQATIDDAKAREAHARKAYDTAMQRHGDGIRGKTIIKDLLGDSKRLIASTPVEAFVDARPKLPEGATVASCQAEVARLAEAKLEVERAPVSIDEALHDIKLQIENAARDGMPSVSGAAEPARQDERGRYYPAKVKVSWPVRRLHEVEPNRLSGDTSAPVIVDTEKVLMALMKDRLLPVLEAEVREAYAVEGVEGINAIDRHRELRRLDKAILAAQYDLAEATWQAIERGEDVEWTPGLPGLALLGLRVDEERLRAAQSGPGRAAA